MTIYERILNIDQATFDRLMSFGILRSNARRDLQIYEYYLSESEKHGSMQAMTNAGDKFNLTDEAIKKIVYRIAINLKDAPDNNVMFV